MRREVSDYGFGIYVGIEQREGGKIEILAERNRFNDTIDGKIALSVAVDSSKKSVIDKLRLSEKDMPVTVWGYLVQTELGESMMACNEYLIPIAVAE